MRIEGLDELQMKLEKLAKSAEGLTALILFRWMKCSLQNSFHDTRDFADANELFGAGGFNAGSQEEFQAIPEDKLDAFIQSESAFSSWQDMLSAAGQEWTTAKMGL